MQTATNHIPQSDYPATVPLSVYRDLAMELQATQARLQQIERQNLQLFQENQQLRQEIHNVVQAVMHLQNIANSGKATPGNPQPHYGGKEELPTFSHAGGQQPTKTKPQVTKVPRPVQAKRKSRKNPSVYIPQPQPVYVEEQEISYYSDSEPEKSAIHSWWMLLAIAFILVSAFGAGYLVVKPLIDSQTR
ncbi:hypothetical protein [Calothrix sp. NIES-3974]|uniref:hypothetical protein n=1 Tax=Calothrix sp. NIES-3974 TaxID=2005462 RepID=UPI000B5E10A2|nr:hypothetical protein [Calothrix sp. NIES-3974]BAZ03717.1 hypothetical protein NIES3974_03470 [Calothrix sp. NIES-3974]